MRGPPRPPPFPYTTLFRSIVPDRQREGGAGGLRARESVILSPSGITGLPVRRAHGAQPRRRDDRERIQGMPHRFTDHLDRKSTRLNSSHANISYAVFCLKK